MLFLLHRIGMARMPFQVKPSHWPVCKHGIETVDERMITRCPKCQTSFRITQAQLETAKGSVRCGSCLHIFKALDNLVQKPQVAATPKPLKTEVEPTSTPKNSDKFASNDELAASKFEYHKPPPAAVSTKDIEDALRSSIELESQNIEIDADDLPEEFEEEEQFSSQDTSDEIPLPEVEQEDEFDLSVDDDLIPDDQPLGKDDGQQNMLVFNQSEIDDDSTNHEIVDDDDLLISDDMELGDDSDEGSKGTSKSAYGDDLAESFLDLDQWSPKETSLFDHQSNSPKDEEDSDDKHSPDESWAVELLEDDGDENDGFNYSGVHDALDEIDLELEEPDHEPPVEEYSRATTGSFNALEDSDIEEALGEPLGEHIEPKVESDKPIQEEELFPEFDYANAEEDYEDDASYEDETSYANSSFEENTYDNYYDDDDKSALLQGISSAPVEFAHYGSQRDWKKIGIWSGAIFTGVFLLVLQVAWLQFDTLSRQQPYRSMYTALCPVFGCDVPPLAAPEMIRASNLVVRSHPNAGDALMVDTILLNTAPFQQPFPDVILNFSDADGQTVAARRFKPQEYLGGELAGRSQMPTGQPVHLSLEIVDPGPDAVSYQAYIPN